MENGNLKMLTYVEIEKSLSRLLFSTYMCMIDENYKDIEYIFEKILDIVRKWIKYYSEDKNLKRITDEESIEAYKLLYEIPIELTYKSVYYEDVENYLDIVTFYPECPINEYFDESKITRRKNK